MPTIAIVNGIIISMYWNDHLPPHFHARYGDEEGKFDVNTLEMFEGTLPVAQRKKVEEWAGPHQETLKRYWKMAQRKMTLPRIQ